MFSFRFSFRSPSRDRETDRLRVAAIRDAVQVGMASATRELEGVRKRLEGSRYEASCLAGTEVFGDVREPEDEIALVKAEERYMSAQQRMTNLTVHIEKLKLIENLLDHSFTDTATKLSG